MPLFENKEIILPLIIFIALVPPFDISMMPLSFWNLIHLSLSCKLILVGIHTNGFLLSTLMCQHMCDPLVDAYNDLCHGYITAISDIPHICAVEKLLEDVVSQIWPADNPLHFIKVCGQQV